jgi:uncharacterized membrane protein YqiK
MDKPHLAYQIYPAALGLPSTVSTLGDVLGLLLPAVVALAGLACFLLILFGGFRYLTSGGDEKAVADAMKMITNAVIGLAIVFGSWWAIRIIETILGLNITQ